MKLSDIKKMKHQGKVPAQDIHPSDGTSPLEADRYTDPVTGKTYDVYKDKYREAPQAIPPNGLIFGPWKPLTPE